MEIFAGFLVGLIFGCSLVCGTMEYTESTYKTFLKTKKLWDEFKETVK